MIVLTTLVLEATFPLTTVRVLPRLCLCIASRLHPCFLAPADVSDVFGLTYPPFSRSFFLSSICFSSILCLLLSSDPSQFFFQIWLFVFLHLHFTLLPQFLSLKYSITHFHSQAALPFFYNVYSAGSLPSPHSSLYSQSLSPIHLVPVSISSLHINSSRHSHFDFFPLLSSPFLLNPKTVYFFSHSRVSLNSLYFSLPLFPHSLPTFPFLYHIITRTLGEQQLGWVQMGQAKRKETVSRWTQ